MSAFQSVVYYLHNAGNLSLVVLLLGIVGLVHAVFPRRVGGGVRLSRWLALPSLMVGTGAGAAGFIQWRAVTWWGWADWDGIQSGRWAASLYVAHSQNNLVLGLVVASLVLLWSACVSAFPARNPAVGSFGERPRSITSILASLAILAGFSAWVVQRDSEAWLALARQPARPNAPSVIGALVDPEVLHLRATVGTILAVGLAATAVSASLPRGWGRLRRGETARAVALVLLVVALCAVARSSGMELRGVILGTHPVR